MMESKPTLWRALVLCVLFVMAVIQPGIATSDMQIKNSSQSNILEFPDSPMPVNDSTLDSYLKKYSHFVLACWKPGCSPCQLIDPKIDQMARDFQGRAAFGKLNIKQNMRTMVRYRVFNYPTLLIFKNGSMIYRHIGNYPIATLEEILSKKLGNNQMKELFPETLRNSLY